MKLKSVNSAAVAVVEVAMVVAVVIEAATVVDVAVAVVEVDMTIAEVIGKTIL